MSRRAVRTLIGIGAAMVVLLVAGRAGVGFYTDVLWFGEVGYLGTFWTRLWLRLGVRGVAALIGAILIFLNLWVVARHLGPVRVRRRYGNLEFAERIPHRWVMLLSIAVALLGGWWLAVLQFDENAILAAASWVRRVPWGLQDPLFGHDVGFYVFTLPFALDALGFLVLVTVWSLTLVVLGHVLAGGIRWQENRLDMARAARLHGAALLAALLLLLAVRYWLARYLLVVEGHGVSGALGYTDVKARLPAYAALAVLSLGTGAALVYGAVRQALLPPIVALGGLLLTGFLLGVAYPGAVQKFRVEPNELSREAPYIRWNLEFTRRAFGLDSMARQRFPYRPAASPAPERVRPLLARVPLWDPEPLQRAFNQMQSLFPYYSFPNVEYDRYGPEGGERQVVIGVREFHPSGLDPAARTWQSLHLNPSYIQGLGAVVAAAHPQSGGAGAPELWVRNINPVITDPTAPPSVSLQRPNVFFGQATGEYAVVVPGRDSMLTGTPGVDFPSGIRLSSFWRVLAFAWRFGDETLLFSGDVDRQSRLLFRRAVRERVSEIVPFLSWDENPLPVIADGKIVWLVDGYTASSSFPLARAVAVRRGRIRYLRPSVKAAVDAVTGAVTFYRVLDDDPLLSTYARIYPALFHPLSDMPPVLRRHLRYPQLALLTQAEVLQEYHVQRVETFYARQDVWERARSTAAGAQQSGQQPMYALVPTPDGSGTVEFLGLLPFIAQSRQNMTAVLFVRNDPTRYGSLGLVELPRDQQIPGPGQVQAMIEQDPVISPELSLLRQRGSGVDMGRMRVLPMDSAVLYIEPLFLSAEENPIPELWRMVVSDGRAVSMGRTLDDALAGLGQAPQPSTGQPAAADSAAPAMGAWPRQALDALDRAQERLRAGDWAGYGQALEELRRILEAVNGAGAPTGAG